MSSDLESKCELLRLRSAQMKSLTFPRVMLTAKEAKNDAIVLLVSDPRAAWDVHESDSVLLSQMVMIWFV
jgi:hypothetical protein